MTSTRWSRVTTWSNNYIHAGLPNRIIIPSVTETGIKSNADIMRSNIIRCYMNYCRNWGRISIRWWVHKRHPYLALTGELWGVFANIWPRDNGAALYYAQSVPTPWLMLFWLLALPISGYDADCAVKNPCLPQGSISTIHSISVLMNDRKGKYNNLIYFEA